MSTRYARTLRYLIEKAPEGKSLLDRLALEIAQQVLDAPIAQKCDFPNYLTELHAIHYSWYIPFLKECAPHLQIGVLSILSKEQVSAIQQREPSLELPVDTPLTPIYRLFFTEWTFNHFFPQDYIPASLLNSGELSILLSISKEELVQLVDILGIQDLSLSVRVSINKRVAESLTAMLTRTQKKYLDYCLHMPIMPLRNATPLEKLNPATILHQTHQWGLQRLAAALSVQEPAFIKTLAYRYDTGRGAFLLQIAPKETTQPTKAVMQLALSIKQALAMLGIHIPIQPEK